MSKKSFIVVIAVFIFAMFFGVAKIDGSSMDSSLSDGQLCLIVKHFHKVNNGDVLVIDTRNRNDIYANSIVKRVIGKPGDTIELISDKFYVNGELLNEDYILEEMRDNKDGKWVLNDNEYFVCGDNRNDSLDSRDVGVFTEDEIIGKLTSMNV